MIAAHLENLLFLLLLALAGLFQLLGRVARKTREDEEGPTPEPAPRTLTPMPRAPAQSDEERIRTFLEALGQPPHSKPPPPVVPRTDIPSRPLAPVKPPTAYPLPPWKKIAPEERRKAVVILRETPPSASAKRVEKKFPPEIPNVSPFSGHRCPL